MAKYREKPTKPKVVDAIQFMGMDGVVPQFSEPVPGWLLAALLDRRIDISTVERGSWITHQAGEMFIVGPDDFPARYVLQRRKSVRKSTAE